MVELLEFISRGIVAPGWKLYAELPACRATIC